MNFKLKILEAKYHLSTRYHFKLGEVISGNYIYRDVINSDDVILADDVAGDVADDVGSLPRSPGIPC